MPFNVPWELQSCGTSPHPAGTQISSGPLSAYGIFGELSQWPTAPSPCLYLLFSLTRVLVSCREASRDYGE